MDYKGQYAAYQEAIEKYLNNLFITDAPYNKLQESMRYSILAGGFKGFGKGLSPVRPDLQNGSDDRPGRLHAV